jgi:DNA invertase Pin-like site-specific DNA recombinase
MGRHPHHGDCSDATFDQNEARQLEGVELDRTFTDEASGKDVNRPQLQAMLEFVREGDLLVVHSMAVG